MYSPIFIGESGSVLEEGMPGIKLPGNNTLPTFVAPTTI
jgi:hypothetical protein